MNAKQKASMYDRIERHGRCLIAVFYHATERDPVKLCKKLRTLEKHGHDFGMRLCNSTVLPSEQHRVEKAILDRVDDLLGFRTSGIPVFLNRDPRGYALKIDDEWMRERSHGHPSHNELPTDWGGYGLIAPDLSE